jgi:hypothetical protein
MYQLFLAETRLGTFLAFNRADMMPCEADQRSFFGLTHIQPIKVMKNNKLNRNRVTHLAMALFWLICSAVQTGAAEPALTGEEAKARMETARNEVANVRSNIFLSLVELDRVRGERDPQRQQFQVFTNQLARMEELARAFGKRAEEMKRRGSEYFSDWEARTDALQNAEAREHAKKRYAERKSSYDAINGFMQEARKSFTPFVVELTNIKVLLEGQHDPKSIALARDLFMRANWDCIDVQRALMSIEREFDQLATSFAKDE